MAIFGLTKTLEILQEAPLNRPTKGLSFNKESVIYEQLCWNWLCGREIKRQKKREKALPFGTLLVGGCHDASFAKGPVQIY